MKKKKKLYTGPTLGANGIERTYNSDGEFIHLMVEQNLITKAFKEHVDHRSRGLNRGFSGDIWCEVYSLFLFSAV